MTKRKTEIHQCPKCKSTALWFKDNGSVLCTVCMNVLKGPTDKKTLGKQ